MPFPKELAFETGAICAAEQVELQQRCERAFQELVLFQTRYRQAAIPRGVLLVC
jgi:hypothetical protein